MGFRELHYRDERFAVKIRLKGDLHSTGSRYQVQPRVKIGKNESSAAQSILGMRTFSLHKLRSRQFYEHYQTPLKGAICQSTS